MTLPGSADRYSLILIGSGFASSFFLKRYLELAPPDVQVLVLERGRRYTHQKYYREFSSIAREQAASFSNHNPEKLWWYTPAFGGSSTCWWACTPRMLPADFKLQSRFGRGLDWPISYNDLEPYYCEAEQVLAVSGERLESLLPRSGEFPQRPHNMNEVDRLLRRAYPGFYLTQPCARPRQSTKRRPRCCATGTCQYCPIDSKFTVVNELAYIYADPRVSLELGAEAERLDIEGGVARSVTYRRGGQVRRANCDLVGLGANAIFNPFLLANSGDQHPQLGKNLCEQKSVSYVFDLDGLDNYSGSTSVTGHGYMLYDGEHRRDRAAVLIENYNVPEIRLEQGRWRQRATIKCIIEDLPESRNHVSSRRFEADVNGVDSRPEVHFHGYSDYCERTVSRLDTDLQHLLRVLPIERLVKRSVSPTENHILGTTRMGVASSTSIVDAGSIHHRYRNVVVLGGSLFPSISPANPTLTICALALRAADLLLRKH